MADVQALLKDCRIKGTIIIKAGPDDGKQVTYEFSADGMGNIIGAWESDYQYESATRMKFSILRNTSAEGQWKHDYAIEVLANLENVDAGICTREFESKTGLPKGSASISPISVDEAVSEGHEEYTDRRKQYQRLGIDGCDPGKVFIHSMRPEPRTDIELFISKADSAFCSLQMMIALSQGFLLSNIYGNIADGLDDGGLSLSGWRRSLSGVGVNADEEDDDNASAKNDQYPYNQPESTAVSDKFNGINWDEAIDEQTGALASSDGLENTTSHNDLSDITEASAILDSFTMKDGKNPDKAEPAIMVKNDDGDDDGDGDGGEASKDDDSAYESIIAGSDGGDEFDMDQADSDDAPQSGAARTDDESGNASDQSSLPYSPAMGTGEEPATGIRNDVYKYMDQKIESVNAALADYDQKIKEARSKKNNIVDESTSLVSLSQAITEEKAKLESMEEQKRGLEKSIKEAASQRSELDDEIRSYTVGKQNLEHDRDWLQALRQR